MCGPNSKNHSLIARFVYYTIISGLIGRQGVDPKGRRRPIKVVIEKEPILHLPLKWSDDYDELK